MSLDASKVKYAGGGVTYDAIAPGSYPARLVGVIDLGLQAQRPYKGEPKLPAYMIQTIYELVDEFLPDEDGEDDETKPRWISEDFPLYSLESDKATSTKRYLSLDPQKVHGGNWASLIDQPCMVTVINNKRPDGKVWANIAGVALMRDKDAKRCPELVNPTLVFDLDDPDMEVYGRIPNWIKKKIMAGLEVDKVKFAEVESHAPAKDEAPEGGAEESPKEELDDEVPY
jgi:hypothetical protein